LPEIPLDPTLGVLDGSVEFVPTLFQIVQLRELLLRASKLRLDPFEFVAEFLDFRLLFVDGLPLLWEILNDPSSLLIRSFAVCLRDSSSSTGCFKLCVLWVLHACS